MSAGWMGDVGPAGSDCKGAGDGSVGTGEGACGVSCSSGTSCTSSTTSGFFLGLPRFLGEEPGAELGASSTAFLLAPLLDRDDAGVASTVTSDAGSLPVAVRLALDGLGVGWVLASEGASSVRAAFFLGRPGVPFLAGVPVRFFEAAPGSGVGAYFLGRPLFFGVADAIAEIPSSSLGSRRGIVVVVVRAVRWVGVFLGLGDVNRRRRTALDCCCCSDSTVTKSFCGDLLSPTSSANVCRLGETLAPPSDMNCFDCWLRVMRRMRLDDTESLRGSGEDIESSSIVAMVGCRWCWAGPLVMCTRCHDGAG